MRNCARVCDAPSCVSGQEELHANHDTYQRKREKDHSRHLSRRAVAAAIASTTACTMRFLSYDDRNLGINNQLRSLGYILAARHQRVRDSSVAHRIYAVRGASATVVLQTVLSRVMQISPR